MGILSLRVENRDFTGHRPTALARLARNRSPYSGPPRRQSRAIRTPSNSPPCRRPRDRPLNQPSITMTQATPAPQTEEEKKRMREKVDKLLAQDPHTSEGSIALGRPPNARTARSPRSFPSPPAGSTTSAGDPEAAVFTIAYLLKDADPRTRPVCFAFNGGPGAASVFLNLGALGPKRVVINDDGTMPLPPYTVTDNPQSWFEHFDLVFVDPPHTGYSIDRQRGGAQEDAERRRRRRGARRVRARLARPPQPLGLADLSSPAKVTARRAAPRSPTSCRNWASRCPA